MSPGRRYVPLEIITMVSLSKEGLWKKRRGWYLDVGTNSLRLGAKSTIDYLT